MTFRKSLYVQLVNYGLVPGNTWWRIRSPGEGGIDHAIFRHAGGVVAPIKRQVLLLVSDSVSEVRVRPVQSSLNLLAIRIEKKFVGIKTVPLLGCVRAIDAVPVQLSRPNLRQVAVPDHVSLLGKRDADGL